MFKKTIAVLLLLSIVLSSCGKKDKDKSNDFTRVTPTPTTPTTSPSTPPVPASAPATTTDSHKARLDCFEAERNFTKLEMSCFKAQLTCPESEYPERDCPESKLPCDKLSSVVRIKAFSFECSDYTPVLPSPEYVEAKKKYLDAIHKRMVYCSRFLGKPVMSIYSSDCLLSKLEERALRILYINSQESCFESESKDTTPS